MGQTPLELLEHSLLIDEGLPLTANDMRTITHGDFKTPITVSCSVICYTIVNKMGKCMC